MSLKDDDIRYDRNEKSMFAKNALFSFEILFIYHQPKKLLSMNTIMLLTRDCPFTSRNVFIINIITAITIPSS